LRFEDVLGRLTGLSCPVFGVSWTPPPNEREAARKLVVFLEDRRVLYASDDMESPSHCVESILKVRSRLTESLELLPADAALTANLRAMRSACRKFLDAATPDVVRHAGYGGHQGSIFGSALGQLRGVFGVQVAAVAQQYGLDVEDDLASILPNRTDQDEESEDGASPATPRPQTARPSVKAARCLGTKPSQPTVHTLQEIFLEGYRRGHWRCTQKATTGL
jgi:hypothetical protein